MIAAEHTSRPPARHRALGIATDHDEEPKGIGLQTSGGASGATWPRAETLAFITGARNPQQ